MKLADLKPLVERKGDENDNMADTPDVGSTGNFITSAQAAVILKVSMSRVRQYVDQGYLKPLPPEKGRRDHLFKLAEVNQLAKNPPKRTGRPPEGKNND